MRARLVQESPFRGRRAILDELHANSENMAAGVEVSISLSRDGTRLWRAGLDSGGDVDVAAIAIDRGALPAGTVYRTFTPEHLYRSTEEIEVGKTRDPDEALGLNCAWYADFLLALTEG